MSVEMNPDVAIYWPNDSKGVDRVSVCASEFGVGGVMPPEASSKCVSGWKCLSAKGRLGLSRPEPLSLETRGLDS